MNTRDIPDFMRQSALHAASMITSDRSSPESVAANTAPLLAWLAAAPDKADLYRRHDALGQQVSNRIANSRECLGKDDPQRLIAETRVLHDVLVKAA